MFRVLESGLSDSRVGYANGYCERVERGGRVIARKTNGERTTENMTCRKVTGRK